MLKRIGAEESGEFKAVASGTLPSGKPVVVNADGTVSVVANIAPTAATPTAITDTAANHAAICYDPDNQKVVIAWYDAGNSDYGTAVVGTVNPSNNTISFGSEVVFESADVDSIGMVYDTANDKVVIAYRDVGNSSFGTAIVGTVSGTSISFGTAVVFESGNSPRITTESMCFDSTNGKVVIVYMDLAAGQKPTAIVGTVSGTGISFGTAHNFQNNTPQGLAATYDDFNEKVVIAMGRSEGGITRTTVRTGTISGTSITVQGVDDAQTLFNGNARDTDLVIEHIGGGKHIVAYADASDSEKGYVDCISLSGNTFTVTADDDPGTLFDEGDVLNMSSTFVASKGQVIITYSDEDTDDSHKGKYVVVTNPSGLTVQVTDPVEFESGHTELTAVVYDTNAERAVVAYQDQGNSAFLTANILLPEGANLTSENYVGIARGEVNFDLATQAIGTPSIMNAGSTTGFAAAFDSNEGKVVVAYADNSGGGIKGKAAVGTVNAANNSISFGSEVVFQDSEITGDQMDCVFDSNSNKVVIFYCDTNNPSTDDRTGTAIVGTVSGTSISFGTKVAFESGHTDYISAVFDSTNNRVVAFYRDEDNSRYGTAVAGTVSGTSISFGTPVAWNSANTAFINCSFDSNAGKILVVYKDVGNSNYGTAVVATVDPSDNSISFGSETNIITANGGFYETIFDSSANKHVVVYDNPNDSNHGYARVGTISGTSVSFGTEVEFENGAAEYMRGVFDSNAGKILILYKDGSNSNRPTIVIGTVSGTDVSFGTPVVVMDVEGVTILPGVAFDSTNNKVVGSYIDTTGSDNGMAQVFQIAYDNTTRINTADGSNTLIDIIGSVVDNQNSLTAGQQYFVKNDGTISETADTPSVLAGTAISATELLVKE